MANSKSIKRTKWLDFTVLVAGGLAILIAVALFLGHKGSVNPGEAPAAVTEPSSDVSTDYSSTPSDQVHYEVTGDVTTTADITYATPTGTSQEQGAELPLTDDYGETGITYSYTDGQFIYISAQNDEEYGSVTCKIFVDGNLVSSNTADGAYAIATCNG